MKTLATAYNDWRQIPSRKIRGAIILWSIFSHFKTATKIQAFVGRQGIPREFKYNSCFSSPPFLSSLFYLHSTVHNFASQKDILLPPEFQAWPPWCPCPSPGFSARVPIPAARHPRPRPRPPPILGVDATWQVMFGFDAGFSLYQRQIRRETYCVDV